MFYGRIRVCYIHIGVGSALLVLLLMAMRRPRCAGQANDQFPRFFYAVTCGFVLSILSGERKIHEKHWVMATFFSLLSTGISCIFYGIITTAVIMAILYFILKSLSRGIVKSVPYYITGVALAFLLICNLSIAIGAYQVKESTESMELSLRQFAEQVSGVVNANESQAIFDMLIDDYPMLGNYLQLADFSGNHVADLAFAMPQEVRSEMNDVIWSNLLWALGYIVVACIVVMIFDRGMYSQKTEYKNGRRPVSSGGYHRRRYR